MNRYRTGQTKTFLQKHFDGNTWITGGATKPLQPYRWAEVEPHDPILIVEGEKDADNAIAHGIAATTFPGGANGWKPEYQDFFLGKVVVVLSDHDEAGKKFCLAVAKGLLHIAREVKACWLPDMPPKGDISDWLELGGKPSDIWDLCDGHRFDIEDGRQWSKPTEPQEQKITVGEPLPDFFPEVIRALVIDITDRMQTSPMAASVAIWTSLCALIGRQARVFPKELDKGWSEVPNLWGMVILPPSHLKSPLFKACLKLIDRLEGEAREKFESQSAVRSAELDLIEKNIKALKNSKKRSEEEVRAELIDLYQRQEEIDSQDAKRFMANDATVEKLGDLIYRNPNGLLIYRDELMGFIMNLYKQGREGDRQFYLESWNGQGSYTVDRIGRGTLRIPALCLSLAEFSHLKSKG